MFIKKKISVIVSLYVLGATSVAVEASTEGMNVLRQPYKAVSVMKDFNIENPNKEYIEPSLEDINLTEDEVANSETSWLGFLANHCKYQGGAISPSATADYIQSLNGLYSCSVDTPEAVLALSALPSMSLDLNQLRFSSGDMTTIPAMPGITSASFLHLHDNNNLTELPAFNSGTNIDIIRITDNDSLKNIDPLFAIDTVTELDLSNNTSLAHVNGLGSIFSIDELFLNNTRIQHVDALTNIDFISKLNLNNNEYLASIEGLSNLTEVGVHLDLTNNPALTDLSPLANLATATSLILDDTTQYTTLLDSSTALCQSLSTGKVQAKDTSPQRLYAKDLCHIESEWLSYFQDHKQLSMFIDMPSWETANTYASLASKAITNDSLPAGSLGVESLYYFDIKDNNLTNVNFLTDTKTVRHSINLSGNDLNDISGLGNLTTAMNSLDLARNPNLTDITPLSNLSTMSADNAYFINLDDILQYTSKPNTSSPFCLGVASSMIDVRANGVTVYADKLCDIASEPWLAFFSEYNTANNVTTLTDWETANKAFYVNSKNLTNDSLPDISIPYSNIYILTMSNNSLENLDFLANVNTSRHDLSFSENNLTDISGLSNLTSAYLLSLANNNLTNLDGLSNLTTVGHSLSLQGNNLTDISGLRNLTSATYGLDLSDNPELTDLSQLSNFKQMSDDNRHYLKLDDINQYTTLPLASSDFCKAVADSSVYVRANGVTVYADKTCDISAEPWLEFFSEHNTVNGLTTLTNWGSVNTNITVSNKGLVNSALPQTALPNTSTYAITMNSNSLDNLDFLSNMNTSRYTLSFKSNNLTNISGLTNLTSAHQLYLSDNNLQNVDGLSNLTTVGHSLNLKNNQLTDISGLRNLTKVVYDFNISGNPYLTDLSPLSNFNDMYSDNRWGLHIDDPAQYTIKPAISSAFCKAVKDSTVDVKFNNAAIYADKICDISAEPWLEFFSEYNAVNGLVTLTDWGSVNTSIDITNKGIVNSALPHDALPNSSIYRINMNSNSLDNLDFLSNMNTSRYILSFKSNNLTDLSGLSNLNTANQLYLNNNNLQNVDGLSNLTTVGHSLNLKNNQLTDISGLRNLTKVVYDFNISGNPYLTDLSPLSNFNDMLSDNRFGLHIDDPAQYTIKPAISSAFCKAVKDSTVDVKFNNAAIYADKICDISAEPWLEFFSEYNAVNGLVTLTDWGSVNTSIDITNKGIVNSALPHDALPNSSIYSINMNSNALDNLDFLINVNTVRSILSFTGNNLTDLSGLSNLNTANKLYLNNNNLQNVDGLSGLTTVNYSLNLYNNQLTDISGLSNLTNVKYSLDLSGNPDLTDLSPLANLKTMSANDYYGVKIDAVSQYTTLPHINSDFCQAMSANVVDVKLKSNNAKVSYGQICK